MMKVTLPFHKVLQQPLSAFASFATTALSLAMTLYAACHHWPSNLSFGVATAITAEVCKLALGWTGITSLHASQTWRGRAGAVACLSLAIVFHLGSIGASVICMSQAESTEHARTLHSSRAYASAVEHLRGIDAELSALRSAADRDIANGFRKRGLATLERATSLGTERQAVEAKLAALERHPATITASTVDSSQILALIGTTLPPDIFNLLIEVAIGSAIELAGFIFLWRSAAPPTPNVPTDGAPDPAPAAPPQNRQRRRTANEHTCATAPSPAPLLVGIANRAAANAAPAPSPPSAARPSATSATQPPSQPRATGAVPATYARYLRYDVGACLEALLQPLESSRRGGACRDLLYRMGNYCLREAGTNGSIETSAIRLHLRAGRDWRTIESHLALLVKLGALTRDGATYTISHFLQANPSAERRAARLAEQRSNVCKRQRKRRHALQRLHPAPPQTVDLTACAPLPHAEKPQPTSHACDVSAAHAATHQPTTAAGSHACNSVEQPRRGPPRNYGAVTKSEVDDAEHEERLRRLFARGVTAEEANEAADCLERELGAKPSVAPRHGECIPVEIPAGPPINEGSVIDACRLVHLPEDTGLIPALFKQLSRDGVTQPELTYAAFCTKLRRDQGGIRQSVVGFMLSTIRRQRAAARKKASRQASAAAALVPA